MSGLVGAWRDRVEWARVARLATVRPDGRPHVVPITFALVGDAVVSAVDQKPKTTLALARLANLATHPVASVLVDHYDDDWAQLWWARGDGPVEVHHDGARREEALVHLAAKYAAYREAPPPGAVIVVAVDAWVTWSAAPPRS